MSLSLLRGRHFFDTLMILGIIASQYQLFPTTEWPGKLLGAFDFAAIVLGLFAASDKPQRGFHVCGGLIVVATLIVAVVTYISA